MHVNFNSKADADKYLSLAGQSADMDYKGSGFAVPYAKEDEDGAGILIQVNQVLLVVKMVKVV